MFIEPEMEGHQDRQHNEKKDVPLLSEFSEIRDKAHNSMAEIQQILDESKLSFFWKQLNERAKVVGMYPIFARATDYKPWE